MTFMLYLSSNSPAGICIREKAIKKDADIKLIFIFGIDNIVDNCELNRPKIDTVYC